MMLGKRYRYHPVTSNYTHPLSILLQDPSGWVYFTKVGNKFVSIMKREDGVWKLLPTKLNTRYRGFLL